MSLEPLRCAARRLAHAPLFSIVAILTLAVGLGANTLIFSVVNGVLLKPLPFADPDRLVGVWHVAPGVGPGLLQQGPATYLIEREENRVFTDIGLWKDASVSVTGLAEPEQLRALRVTDGTLPLLGVRPALGRVFTRADDSPGTAETVVLTHAYWLRAFGGDASAVGRVLVVDGRPREIVGVLPASFRFLNSDPALLLPFRLNRAEVFVGDFSYQAVARLKPGVTLAQANADVARMLPLMLEKFPLPPGLTRAMIVNARLGPAVHPLSVDVVGDIGSVLWVLLGTVGIVLLVACANVANLFLVRAEGRQQELAIRTALGAGPARIAKELLGESLALGLVGGALGVGLAYAGLRLLVALGPGRLPRLDEIALDPVVLLATLVLSLAAGLIFGAIPVVKYATPRLAAALKEGGRGSSDGRERHRARNVLVVAQVALALVLLVGAGLMMRTFVVMRRVNPGFVRPAEVLTVRLSIPEALVRDDDRVLQMHRQIEDRLRAIPGVETVGVTSSVTMDGWDSNDPVFVEDHPEDEGKLPPIRRFKWIGESYFQAMGNPLLAGRVLTWGDATTRAPVVVVSESFARQYWPTPAAALGKRIRETPKNPWREIVGVVGDDRDDGVTEGAIPIIYWPMAVRSFWEDQDYVRRSVAYAIRSSRLDSPGFLKEVQEAVWSVDPNLPLADVRTLEQLLDRSMARTSFALVMLAIASGVALFLGLVGLYGVIAYIVSQRTREVGIRMALGAHAGDVRRLFVRHGLALTATGLALGLIAAAALMRVMSALLFGVSPFDPATYGLVAALLGGVALVAVYLPARRATRVDPSVALRSQ